MKLGLHSQMMGMKLALTFTRDGAGAQLTGDGAGAQSRIPARGMVLPIFRVSLLISF